MRSTQLSTLQQLAQRYSSSTNYDYKQMCQSDQGDLYTRPICLDPLRWSDVAKQIAD
jgi:hypothetical protein